MVAQNNLEVGMKCIKYMLFCVTAIFVLTSALIISVGTTIYAIYHDVSFFLDDHFFSPATLVIVIGVIMLFVSMFGCVGAWRESTCLVNIFAVILSLVFILEIAAAIAAYSLRSQVLGMLDTRLRYAMPYYYENQEVTDAFDFIQSRLNCCGVDTYFDWHAVPPPEGATGIAVANITVPNSCCAESHYSVVEDVTVAECTKLYANGCLPRVIYLVYQSAGLLGAGAMTIAFIQLTSALIISVGTTIYAIYHDVSFFLDDHFFSPATLVIVIGVIMLFVSMFGCVGAWRESTCLVNIFAVILSLVFILEIAAAIAAYSLRSQVLGMLDTRLRYAMPYYYENQEVTDAFDFIQSRLNCCGVDTYFDWHAVPPPEGATGIAVANITVPNSCCAESHYSVVEDVTVAECTKLYANGCLPRVIYLVYQSAGLLGAGAMTIAFIQLIGIVFSFSLASSIRRAKTERERRRQEIQERVINCHTTLNPDGEKIKPIVYVPFYGQTQTAA